MLLQPITYKINSQFINEIQTQILIRKMCQDYRNKSNDGDSDKENCEELKAMITQVTHACIQ